MNRLSAEKQRIIVASLVRGNSVRSTAEIVRTNIPTILRNSMWIGRACQDYHDAYARNLNTVKFLECDELTSIIYAKDVNLPPELKGLREVGDMWTWVGMCPQSRLVISWLIGKHSLADASMFAHDLASRVPGGPQIHSDQLLLYRPVFEDAFGDRASYATTRKTMGPSKKGIDNQYEQPDLIKVRQRSEFGNPDLSKVTTNHVERLNLTLRTWNKGYTRRTIAFAKKLANVNARLALNLFYYNFVHQHASLDGLTAAMVAGITDRLWSIEDMIRLVPQRLRSDRK